MITFREYIAKRQVEEGVGDWLRQKAMPYALAGSMALGSMGVNQAQAVPPSPQLVKQVESKAKIIKIEEVGKYLEVTVQMPYSALADKMGLDDKAFHVKIARKVAFNAAVQHYGVKPADLEAAGADKPMVDPMKKLYTQKFYITGTGN